MRITFPALSFLVLVFSGIGLSGCTVPGMIVGAGASAGVASVQEGGFKRAISDAKIQTEINDLWFKYSVEAFSKLDMTVNNGRVLLTGVVQDPEQRVEAVRLAWQPQGVEQVINEIKIAESSGVVGFARDAWISARLRTTLTFDRDVQSVNYSIDTVQGTVYLMGLAQSQSELNRVIETARTIPDVRQVVSYVKMSANPTNPDPNEQTPTSAYTEGDYGDSETGDADSAPIQLEPVESQPLY